MNTEIRGLSIKQPWATKILDGEKTIETRTWPTKYRGKILICVSQKPKIDPYGVAVATANIVTCRKMVESDGKQACCEIYDRAWSWFLDDITPIVHFPIKGRLSLFRLTDDELGSIRPLMKSDNRSSS
jgi:hypothetical protein